MIELHFKRPFELRQQMRPIHVIIHLQDASVYYQLLIASWYQQTLTEAVVSSFPPSLTLRFKSRPTNAAVKRSCMQSGERMHFYQIYHIHNMLLSFTSCLSHLICYLGMKLLVPQKHFSDKLNGACNSVHNRVKNVLILQFPYIHVER